MPFYTSNRNRTGQILLLVVAALMQGKLVSLALWLTVAYQAHSITVTTLMQHLRPFLYLLGTAMSS